VAPSGAGRALRRCCAHCGLPLGKRPFRIEDADGVAEFCCPGCSLAAQVTRARGEPAVAAALLLRLGLGLFFAMNVMMVSMGTYAPYVYGGEAGAADGPLFVLLRVLAGLLSIPALLLLGGPILRSAAASVAAGRANADVLVALAVVAALALSVRNLAAGGSDTYFDTALMLLVLVILGRFLEAKARADAGSRIRRSGATAPASIARLRDDGSERVSADDLVRGDVVDLDPGQAIPTDAVVLAGAGGVDESCLTGEARPVAKAPGSELAGGTINLEARLRARVLRPRSESAAARIEALLEEARREPARIERAADRLAAWMVPAVVALAIGTAVFWSARVSLETGLLTGIAVLVVACPCALGIATPLAIWSGLAAAAARGVVVRSAPALERAARVRRVLFDKTGTLTGDAPELVAVEPCRPGLDEEAVLARAAALETGVPHPVARAIVAAARARGLVWPEATDLRVEPGRGVAAIVAGEQLRIEPRPMPDRGAAGSIASLRDAAGELGRLRVRETIRPGAREAVAELRRRGMRVAVLTGDGSADAILPALGAPLDVRVRATPAEKLEHVRSLRAAWPDAPLAMVGDGFNDAPALAAADLGVACANATDLARLSADAVVLGGDLAAVPWLLDHARRVLRVVHQNLAWTVGYNAVAMALAAAGLLTPLAASLAMIASSIAVVANTGRLRSRPASAAAAGQGGAARGFEIGGDLPDGRGPGRSSFDRGGAMAHEM
jgi:Cu2+-exporting ATPase